MIYLDIDITVAEVVLAGELASADLQPRLSPVVSADMDLLRTVLDAVSLQLTRDTRWIRGGPSTAVRVSDIYKALWSPVGGPPMADVNWDCFAPKKVKIFFWILRHDPHVHSGVPPPSWGT